MIGPSPASAVLWLVRPLVCWSGLTRPWLLLVSSDQCAVWRGRYSNGNFLSALLASDSSPTVSPLHCTTSALYYHYTVSPVYCISAMYRQCTVTQLHFTGNFPLPCALLCITSAMNQQCNVTTVHCNTSALHRTCKTPSLHWPLLNTGVTHSYHTKSRMTRIIALVLTGKLLTLREG